MLLEIRAAPPFHKNGYVLACRTTRQGVLVDPGHEVEQLLRVVAEEKLTIRRILLTHAHVDHVSGTARAKAATGAPIVLHRADLPIYERAVEQGAFFGLDVEAPPPVDEFYDLSTPIEFGRLAARVLHTPGHTPGGVCLLVGPAGRPGVGLFAGDTLFAESIGRTDLPGGDYDTLMTSIRDVLLVLPDDLPVYPGHGPATTIGRERKGNPFLTGYRG
jgi:glyoxylase-like metal-dependent hydrolase (beta-lactamase superfamily II)